MQEKINRTLVEKNYDWEYLDVNCDYVYKERPFLYMINRIFSKSQ